MCKQIQQWTRKKHPVKKKNTHCCCGCSSHVDNGKVRPFFHLHILIKEKRIIEWLFKNVAFSFASTFRMKEMRQIYNLLVSPVPTNCIMIV